MSDSCKYLMLPFEKNSMLKLVALIKFLRDIFYLEELNNIIIIVVKAQTR